MRNLRRDDSGSILILAVIAMLILGVLGLSFALLARVETNIGVNYKQQAQAEALAEAGLDRARDLVRTAGAGTSGFTKWFDGTNATHMLVNGQTLGAGQYWARIDNDCPSAFTGTPAFPTYLRESSTCDNTTDANEKAVVTAWAVSGTGRVRVRAMVGVDSPWKHVCSDAAPDNGGYCNDTRNTKGNPAVSPADPNDPNGPKPYSDLPRPIIGCSRIDPALHRSDTYCATAAMPKLYSQPGITGYPAYPSLGTAPQLVVMGEDPAVTASAKKCNVDPGNPSIYYFGYFDCALSTPCPQTANVPGCESAPRKACVFATDSRVNPLSPYYDSANYASNAGGCGGANNTGMVWQGSVTFNHNVTIGSPSAPVVVYMLHDNASPSTANIPTLAISTPPSPLIYGTVVVEGHTAAANKIEVCTGGPAPSPLPANPCPSYYTGASNPPPGYGYPVAFLAYDPKLAYPTINPYVPQPTTTDFATPNTHINGMVYSGGNVSFNPISVNGSTVAFGIDLQATSSTYQYIPQYGDASPPAAFPAGASNPVVLLQKSFVMCDRYSTTEATQASGCQ